MLNFLTSSQNLTPFDKNQTVPTAKLFPVKYKKIAISKIQLPLKSMSVKWYSYFYRKQNNNSW